MKRILAVMLPLTLAAPAWGQDFEKDLREYDQRDYATALREWRLLGAQGQVLYATISSANGPIWELSLPITITLTQ